MPLQRLRIHDYLVMTQTLMWSRAGDTAGRARPRAARLRHRRQRRAGRRRRAARGACSELWSEGLAIEDEADGADVHALGDAPAPDRGRARPGRVIAAVVLAAGEGRRYGGLKQLHPVDGRPMLEQVLRTLAAHRARAPGGRAGRAGGHDPRAHRPARRAAGGLRPLGRGPGGVAACRPGRAARRGGLGARRARRRAGPRPAGGRPHVAPRRRPAATRSWPPTTAAAARTRC